MPSSSRRRSSSFRIWSWMVTSSAVVGSSASSSVGRAGERDGDHRALAHAAGELVRVVVEALARRPGCRPWSSSSTARAAPRARGRGRCGRRRLSSICRPTVSTGLSAVIGSWKIMAISRAAHARAARARGSADAGPRPRQRDAARRPGAGGRTRPQDRAQRDALAGAGFADQAQHLARRDVEVDAVDGGERAARRGEAGAQAARPSSSGAAALTGRAAGGRRGRRRAG